jgi:hypothetical protein
VIAGRWGVCAHDGAKAVMANASNHACFQARVMNR